MSISQPAATEQATAALLARPDLPTQLGVDAGSRLYELWNAIFARAGTSGSEQPPPATPRPHLDSRVADNGQGSHHTQTSGHSWLAGGESLSQPVSPGLVLHGGADPVADPFQALVATVNRSSTGDHPTSFARSPSSRLPGVSSEPDVHEAAYPPTATPLPGETSTPAPRSNMTDSISVYLRGAAVSIVVRDATLSTRDAVDCAFETARQLTGNRGALLRLTLNGQTLYQQQAAGARRVPALLFAC